MRKRKAKLPDPQNIPIIQLLSMDREQMVAHVAQKRRLNDEPLSINLLFPDEVAWVSDLIEAFASVSLILENITVSELNSYGLKYKKIEKRAGPKQAKERRVAMLMVLAMEQKPTVVWETYVLPELIEQGKIKIDGQGKTDPIAVESEKAAFFKYLARERRKFPEIPPKKRGYFGVLT